MSDTNALKHGAFADVVILPGEDPNELNELRTALCEEWNPEGPTEIDLVESIAMGMWRKRRFILGVMRKECTQEMN